MDEGLMEAARAVRPYLVDLMGERARTVDAALAALLLRAVDGADVGEELYALITADPRVRTWAAALLGDPHRRPPQVVAVVERATEYAGLPGRGEPVDAQRYACPRGDFVWWRVSVGEPRGVCPDHPDVPLVLA